MKANFRWVLLINSKQIDNISREEKKKLFSFKFENSGTGKLLRHLNTGMTLNMINELF